MDRVVAYWEKEGFLFSVPDELKEDVAHALEAKAKNVREGKDFKDHPDDYDQEVIRFLDAVEVWKNNKEFFDED